MSLRVQQGVYHVRWTFAFVSENAKCTAGDAQPGATHTTRVARGVFNLCPHAIFPSNSLMASAIKLFEPMPRQEIKLCSLLKK